MATAINRQTTVHNKSLRRRFAQPARLTNANQIRAGLINQIKKPKRAEINIRAVITGLLPDKAFFGKKDSIAANIKIKTSNLKDCIDIFDRFGLCRFTELYVLCM